MYGQWVISGVVEEKNSRVVEVILSTVQPRHLLAGKVIGIGLLGLGQVALLAGLAAALLVAGAFDAPAALGGSLVLVVPWFALGFGLYAVAYATAGALASRQQSPDTAGQPVTYTLVAAYLASYAAVSANSSSLLANVLTVFPLESRRGVQRPRSEGRHRCAGGHDGHEECVAKTSSIGRAVSGPGHRRR